MDDTERAAWDALERIGPHDSDDQRAWAQEQGISAEVYQRAQRRSERDRQNWQALRDSERAAATASHPVEALDARVRLVSDLRSPRGLRVGASAYQGWPESLDQAAASPGAPAERIAGSQDSIEHLAARLRLSATYWLAPEMVELVEVAAPHMPAQPVLASDLPCAAGFAWLPCTAGDDHGVSSLRALAWDLETTGSGKLRLTHFVDLADACRHADRDPEEVRARGGGFALFPVAWQDWTLGRPWEPSWVLDEHRGAAGPVKVRPANDWLRRFAQAMWSLMAEPYVALNRQPTPRPAERRAQRAAIGNADSIQVVTLRRARRPSEPAGQSVEWSHRWIVAGHWRQQWYPSMNTHRARYILPYVKGPDDKPLVAKDRVYALRR